MANEAERINNPDSTPGAVSTGYQLQNTNMISSRVGLDNSVLEGGTGQCILRVSGPVDVNGEIYTINSEVTFTLSTAGKYYVHLAGSGANLTPTIGTGANTFDADKNARYTNTGSYRVLNWVIYYNGTTAYVHGLTNPVNADNDYGDVGSFEEYFITSDSTWTAKRSKYYTMYVTGSGGDGAAENYGGGGAAGATGIKRLFITAGTTWTATFSATAGQSTIFTDGITTLTAKNGGNGNSAHGGQPATTSTGFDFVANGGWGHNGIIVDANNYAGGSGGASLWGSGGSGDSRYSGGTAFGAEAGASYGSGGGGGATAGLGKIGCIRIIG